MSKTFCPVEHFKALTFAERLKDYAQTRGRYDFFMNPAIKDSKRWGNAVDRYNDRKEVYIASGLIHEYTDYVNSISSRVGSTGGEE